MSTKRNSKKDLPDDEALDEVNKHIKDAFDILKRETNKLRKERNAFDEVAKKLEHVHFSTMLKLNVGGHFFSTSLATMTKDPGTLKQVLNFELRFRSRGLICCTKYASTQLFIHKFKSCCICSCLSS